VVGTKDFFGAVDSEALGFVEEGKDLPEGRIFVCPVCGNTVTGAAPKVCPICSTAGEKFFEVS
jgi:rubrerythrin